jgi:hypothetical protein
MAKKEHVKIVTPTFRVSFPAVFQPKTMGKPGEGGKAKYSVSALFRIQADAAKPNEVVVNPAEFQALRDLATAAAIEKWGSREKFPKNLQTPFRNGAEKDYDGYDANIVFCTFSSDYRPGLVGPDLKEIIDPKEFYGGCYARAKVHAYAWEYMGKSGVSFSLWHLQKVKDGAPFGGGGDASKEFEALAVPASAASAGAAPAGGGFGL